MKSVTISAVLTAYNAEPYVRQAVSAILSQTRPPEDVIVVDDGSTDGTPDALRSFGCAIRVITQENAGHAAALNRGFAEARGDYLAKCDADDIWEPRKLERQCQAVSAHPQIDVAFSAVQVFGLADEPWGLFDARPGIGLVDLREFTKALYRANVICPSSTLISRRVYQKIGPFASHLNAEDYDYWFRALRAGAVFYYDPAVLVRYRRHDQQITKDYVRTHRALIEARGLHADLVDDRQLVRAMHASGFFKVARALVDAGCPQAARRDFVRSLRYARGATASANARALAWLMLLSLPAGLRDSAGQQFVRGSRAFDGRRGGRHPALP